VLSHISHTNIVALAASFISSSSSKVYIVEHNNLTARQVKLRRAVFVRMLMRLMYPLADKVICVSDGVSNDIRNVLKLNPSKVKTIFNPVVNSNITTKSREKPNHSWLTRSDVPVFLGIGRFTEQKDFENLLMAFAQLLRMVDARLIILGDGPLRCRLESVITELKLSSFVSLPGFVDNPYSFLSRASCFVLSSKYEGLPTVLIEALACGCDVVATDCPSGPSEILKNGEIGRLVPVEDSESLAAAMYESLKSPTCREKLKLRATAFTPSVVIPQYVSLLTGD
jgi:glycosyltransferase involved in cell wall biosynthesis